MRKFALILFFIVSLTIFAQSEVPFVAPILPGEFKDTKIIDNYLFVNRHNIIQIYNIETMEQISKIPVEGIIHKFNISDSLLSIYTSNNPAEPYDQTVVMYYLYNIFDISSPVQIHSSNLNDYDMVYYFDDNVLMANNITTCRSLRHTYLVRFENDSLEFSNQIRQKDEFYMNSELLISRDNYETFIFDIRDFYNVVPIDSFSYNRNIYCDGDFLVIRQSGRAVVYDLSDIDSIHSISTISESSNPVYIFENYVYFQSGDSLLTQYDISDPLSPVLTGSLEVLTKNFSFCDSIAFNSGRCYNLRTMELISDFSSTQLDIQFQNTHYQSFDNNKLVCTFPSFGSREIDSVRNIGLLTYDMTELSSPTLTHNLQKSYNYKPKLYHDNFLLAVDSIDYCIADLSDLNNITYNEYSFDHNPSNFETYENFGFISYESNGIQIYDFNDLSEIEILYENTDFDVKSFSFYENYVFILENDNNLSIMNIITFEILSTITFDTEVNRVLAYNGYLYAAKGEDGLSIFDITEITSPREFYFAITHNASNIHIVNGNLLVSTEDNVYNYNLSIPYIPTIIRVLEGTLTSTGEYMSEESRIGDREVYTITSLRNPDSPEEILSISEDHRQIEGKGNILLVYVSWGPFTYIMDTNESVSEHAAPLIYEKALNSLLTRNIMFVNNRGYGISAYDISGITDSVEEPHSEIHTPDELGLSFYPNPFNSAVSIETKGAEKIEIFDINGKKVAQFNTNENTNINWTPEKNINSGVYLVKAMSNINQRSDGSRELTAKVIYTK